MTETAFPAPDSPTPREGARGGLLRSPAAKFFLIAILSAGLVVPLLMVWALVSEREGRSAEVARTIAEEWAEAQTVTGPLLLVPFTVETSVPGREGGPPAVAIERRTAVILPDELKIQAEAPTEARRISIFETTVYTASITLAGRFGAVDPQVFGPGARDVEWNRAVMAVRLGDLGGVEEATFKAADQGIPVEPGIGTPAYAGWQGLHAALSSSPAGGMPFTVTLRLKGTASLAFAPVGRDSEITLASDWPHPSFALGSLPSQRTVRPDGFDATWRIPFFTRNIPQAWTAENEDLSRFDGERVGAEFRLGVDFYDLVGRALKYGLMFVGGVFGIVFVLEILSPRRIHIVQYAIVGLILVFFYVLLLALAEQIGFSPAYAAASSATGLVVTVFVGLQLESRSRAFAAGAGFATLFGMLYAILRLEDVALLAGALLGFALLTLVLFATRRVDWSGNRPGRTAPPA